MKRMIVRYKIKADRAAENEAFIRGVFEQLEREKPSGLRYASFRAADGVSFVHIVSVETANGRNPLIELSAFKAFTSGVEDRWEDLPITTELNEIGSYRFFGE